MSNVVSYTAEDWKQLIKLRFNMRFDLQYGLVDCYLKERAIYLAIIQKST